MAETTPCSLCDLELRPNGRGAKVCEHCDAPCTYRFCRRCNGAAKGEDRG